MMNVSKEVKKVLDENEYPGYEKIDDVRQNAIDFSNDYDWDNMWEDFNPIEAVSDAYVAGYQYKNGIISEDDLYDLVCNLGYEFANDYDWDYAWEAFDPIEACQDAYIAGYNHKN